MRIPANMLITLEIAKESPIGMKMVNENLQLLSPKHSYLATFLLQEKRIKNSKWENYLKILPENYENFPIFFNDEEKKWLDGSPFLYQINEKLNEIETDYKTIRHKIPEFEIFSLKEFSDARMVVSSRIFGIKINNKKTDCFAPLADMLNHRRPRKTKWYYSDQIKSFVIHAINEIEKGEEVIIEVF
jgi:histone-lysine N-methyltransferase SETD3